MRDYEDYETVYTYTATGQVSTITAPGSKVWDYDYNALGQQTKVTLPNDMTSNYSYDIRNRLTKIEHKDGSTVKEGWSYALDSDGNILRMASAVSGSKQAWDYAYDKRHRLVDAIRKNENGTPELRESYTYDAGDNMTEKWKIAYEVDIREDFSDGYAHWLEGDTDTWDTSNGYAENDTTDPASLYRLAASADYDLWFSYYGETSPSGTLDVDLRGAVLGGDTLKLRLKDDRIQLYSTAGGGTVLAENTDADTATGQWYDVYVQCQGPHVSVWRAEQGDALVPVLEIDDCEVLTSAIYGFETAASKVFRIDDVKSMLHRPITGSAMDNFAGNTLSADWTEVGTWTQGSGVVQCSGASLGDGIFRETDNADGEYWFSYYLPASGDGARIDLRRDDTANDSIVLFFSPGDITLKEEVGGSLTTLETATTTSTITKWYDAYVKTSGSNIEVWQGESQSGTLTKINDACTTSASVLSGNRVGLLALNGHGVEYDNFSFRAVGYNGRSFGDDFQDGDYTDNVEWGVLGDGTWDVAGSTEKYVTNDLSATDDSYIGVDRSFTSGKLSFRYAIEDTSATDPSFYANWLDFETGDTMIVGFSDTVAVIASAAPDVDILDYNYSAATTLTDGTEHYYDVDIVQDGNRVEVWRAPAGGTPELILSTTSGLELDHNAVVFSVGATFKARIDNVRLATDDTQHVTFNANNANELRRMCDTGTQTTFAYDDWGRQVTKTVGGGHADYGYQYGSMLARVDSTLPGDPDTVQYLYDGMKKRREVVVMDNSVEQSNTWYRYDRAWNAVAAYSIGASVSTAWDIGTRNQSAIYADVTPLAEVPGSNPSTGAYRHYLRDHLGSTRALYDASKALLARVAYAPYGEQAASTAGVEAAYTFTGKQWDDDTGLYFFPYRYYAPDAGRWVWRDPLGSADGPNVYEYVNGCPTMYIDVDGRIISISPFPGNMPHCSNCRLLCMAAFTVCLLAVAKGTADCMGGCLLAGPFYPECAAACGLIGVAGVIVCGVVYEGCLNECRKRGLD